MPTKKNGEENGKEPKKPNGTKKAKANGVRNSKPNGETKGDEQEAKVENGADEKSPIDVPVNPIKKRISSNSIKAIALTVALVMAFFVLINYGTKDPQQPEEEQKAVVKAPPPPPPSPPTYNVGFRDVNGIEVSADNCWFVEASHLKAIDGLTRWAGPLGIETILIGGTITSDGKIVLDTQPNQQIPIEYFTKKAKTSKTLCLLSNPNNIEIPEMYWTSTGEIKVFEGRHTYAGFIPSIRKTTILESDNTYGHLSGNIMEMELGKAKISVVSSQEEPMSVKPIESSATDAPGIWDKTKQFSSNAWEKTKGFFEPKESAPAEEFEESLRRISELKEESAEIYKENLKEIEETEKKLREGLERARANQPKS